MISGKMISTAHAERKRNVRIISNFQYRDIITSYEVPPSVLDREFHYHSPEERESAFFFKYKNQYYCLDQFMQTTYPGFKDKGWDGYYCDSYYSGVLVRLDLENDKVKVATYNS